MIRIIGILLLFVAAVVLTVTGFGWFGSSADNSVGWIGLAFLGIGLVYVSPEVDARLAARRSG